MHPRNLFGPLLLFVYLLLQPAFATAALYADNRDGTVTDSATGLTWMRCSVGQTWNGSTCTGTAIQYPTWTQAKSWWEATGVTREFAGKNDWRLPSGRELQSIIDTLERSPAIDRAAFPNTPSITYWSATPHHYPNDVLSVSFDDGWVGGQNMASPAAVRAVRGEQWLGALTPHPDGTVADASSGLTWMRCSMGQNWDGRTCTGTAILYTWDEANALTQSFAGQNDWRLPTERELFSIFDLSALALDPIAFPNEDGTIYWSASRYTGSATPPYTIGPAERAWEVSLGWLEAGTANISNRYAVRMVRVGPDNGDGTVFDSETGLTWMRCPLGQTWTGRTCLGPASTTKVFPQALTHNYAGQSDWRLPSIDELRSIKQASPSPLYIDLKAFPNTSGLKNWSSSMILGPEDGYSPVPGIVINLGPTRYWSLDFATGNTVESSDLYSFSGLDLSTRLVRGAHWTGPERSKPFAESWSPQDCLFNWAEKNYPHIYAPAGSATKALDVFNFRHYPGTQAYLGVSSRDHHLYYLGILTNNSFYDQGPASYWYLQAKCQ